MYFYISIYIEIEKGFPGLRVRVGDDLEVCRATEGPQESSCQEWAQCPSCGTVLHLSGGHLGNLRKDAILLPYYSWLKIKT